LRLLYSSFSKAGGDRLAWRLGANRLRILCYHGVCEDRLANAPWVPHCFVTATAFERQLQYLGRHANVLPLDRAIAGLMDGSLPPRCVALTFDDGYANNLEIAYPLLRKYDTPATIFLSTAYIESGGFFPFLKQKLILQDSESGVSQASLPDYKTAPIDDVNRTADEVWERVEGRLNTAQRQTLRPLTIVETQNADAKVIQFGPHSDTHCILRNESRERRQAEIETSIRKVEKWTGKRIRFFSYPNGERGDFDETDKSVLRTSGIQAAVTGIGGANKASSDLLELRRYPVGLYHDDSGFCAEVTGFRNAVLWANRRFES